MTSRSFLYVPANKPALFDKGVAGEADAIIIDLEDAVPLTQKATARKAVREWLEIRPSSDTEVWVRVTPEFLTEDLDAVAWPGIAGIMVAKCSEKSLIRTDQLLTEWGDTRQLGAIELIGLIETAHALRSLPDMARCNRIRTFGIGEVDLLADLRIKRTPATTHVIDALRTHVVIDCAAAGLAAPVAPTSTDFRNLDDFAFTTEQFVDMGFRARTALHPAQVPIINAALTPSEEDVSAARRVIELYNHADNNPVVDDSGRFVDEAVIRGSREILGRVVR